MELLKLLQRKLLKISVFSFKTFTSRFKISFSICFWSTSIKLKLPLSLHLLWIAIILGWFLYFKFAFKVKVRRLNIFRYQGSVLYWKRSYLKTSAVSRLAFTSSLFSINWVLSLSATLSDRRSFTVLQNSLFLFRFLQYFFYVFFKRETQKCLCFV